MGRRVGIVTALCLLVAGSAWAHGTGGPSERKQEIDDKIASLRGKIAAANEREGVLTSEIAAVSARIRSLQGDVERVSSRLSTLEGELAIYEARLASLTALYQAQTRKLELLRRQHRVAERRLRERLVAIYESNDPTAVEVVLSAASFSELVDGLDYVEQIGRLDRRIATQVATARRKLNAARAETARTRTRVRAASEAIRRRVTEQRAERDRLVATRSALASARSEKSSTLASIEEDERHFLHEVEGLEKASAALAATIRSAQRRAAAPASSGSSGSSGASTTTAVSSSGFIWPVSGTVTSGFGWRWGRMHEGIDIAAPSGTPIRAAASGTVIYAGWMSGYGNLVVVDHGGGLSTAYAHMSSIAAGNGQAVVQGQTIGYVGCTGSCFGDHLHFEVRVNGSAVDPMGYL